MTKKRDILRWQIYFGFVLVISGGLFLVDQLYGFGIMRPFWPLMIVLFGMTFFAGMLDAGRRGSGLAIPGAVIAMIGLLLIFQNRYNQWATWAYTWTLIISAVGVGLLIMNLYHKRVGLRRVGGILIGTGLVLFVLFGFLFEFILGVFGTSISRGVFPGAGLVLLGLFVAFSRPIFSGQRHSKPAIEDRDEAIVDASFKDLDDAPTPVDPADNPLVEDAEYTDAERIGD